MDIEKVKEHFKNAKVVKRRNEESTCNIEGLEIKLGRSGFYYGCRKNGYAEVILYCEKYSFANIIEYKEEKLNPWKPLHLLMVDEVKEENLYALRDKIKKSFNDLDVLLSKAVDTMLDEVKEVEVLNCYLNHKTMNVNSVNYSFNFTVRCDDMEGLNEHLEQATKEFFKNKNKQTKVIK